MELVAPYYFRTESIPEDKIRSVYEITPESMFQITHLPTRLTDHSTPMAVRFEKLLRFSWYFFRLFLVKREQSRYERIICYSKCLISSLPMLTMRRLFLRKRVLTVFEAAAYSHGFWEKWILKRFDYIVAINPVLKEDLIRELALDPDKIIVPPLGMDSAFHEPLKKSKEDARRLLGLPTDDFIVLYSGKITLGTDSEIALLLKAAQLAPFAQFYFTGGKPEVIKYYNELAGSLGLQNLHFTGFFESLEMPLLYMRAADVLLSYYPRSIPTLRYMIPNKILQYARAGRVIVSARYPAIEFMLGPNGAIYVEPEKPPELALTLKRISEGEYDTAIISQNAVTRLSRNTIHDRTKAILEYIL
ncbi:MAG: glycosyltransferase family 4 protein [Chloroflexi bacterium]|nr:glycosyltransferase family 4 protein [Chloroflexota bacterium]